MVIMLLAFRRSAPSLFQFTSGLGKPPTMHIIVNVVFHGTDLFFRSGSTLGGTER